MIPADLADPWNAAYPTMRAIATSRITAYRRQIADRVWDIDPANPNADILRAYTPTEPRLRRQLKNAETLRRTLHQLDHGTHRPCTQSPAAFSPFAAYGAVRGFLRTVSANDRGLGDVYRLAAVLAEAVEERCRELAERHEARTGVAA